MSPTRAPCSANAPESSRPEGGSLSVTGSPPRASKTESTGASRSGWPPRPYRASRGTGRCSRAPASPASRPRASQGNGGASCASASGCTAGCAKTPWPASARLATTSTTSSTSSSWAWWRRARSAARGSAEELVQEFLDPARVRNAHPGRHDAQGAGGAGDHPLDLVLSLGQGHVHVDAPVGKREGPRGRDPHVRALVEQVLGPHHAVADRVGGRDGLEVERSAWAGAPLRAQQRGGHRGQPHHF